MAEELTTRFFGDESHERPSPTRLVQIYMSHSCPAEDVLSETLLTTAREAAPSEHVARAYAAPTCARVEPARTQPNPAISARV